MEQEQVPPTNDMSVEEQIQYIDRHVFSTPVEQTVASDVTGIWEAAMPILRSSSNIANSTSTITVGTAGASTGERLEQMFRNPIASDYTEYSVWIDGKIIPRRRMSRRDKKKEKEFNFLLSIKTIKNEGKEGA